MDALEHLKYPIGRFAFPEKVNAELRSQWIETISNFPAQVTALCEGLSPEQLNTPYRPEGWTLKQVVHHCADSHMNSYLRFKLALTEDQPTITPYDEVEWAKLPDALELDLSASIAILAGLHTRWTVFLKNLAAADWERSFYHPANEEHTTLLKNLAIYDWHCRHHLAHMKLALTNAAQ